jgi:hypothetical protein
MDSRSFPSGKRELVKKLGSRRRRREEGFVEGSHTRSGETGLRRSKYRVFQYWGSTVTTKSGSTF